MDITFTGTNNSFFGEAFFSSTGAVATLSILESSSTQIRAVNVNTGAITTFIGTGFAVNQNTGNFTGTISQISFAQYGATQAIISGITWDAATLTAAVAAVGNSSNFGPIAALFNSAGPIYVEASGAGGPLYMVAVLGGVAELLTQPIIVNATGFNDVIMGAAGNDTLNIGKNTYGVDVIYGTSGNDTITFADVSPETFVKLEYSWLVSGSMVFNVNGSTNTGTIQGTGFVDTLVGVRKILQADGLGFIGGDSNDTFNLRSGAGGWFEAEGRSGNDTYNLTLDNDSAGRLTFLYGGNFAVTQGLVMNLATGVVSNDGFGDTDQINILGGNGYLEIRATQNSDSIIGSARDESYILELGNDTLDGGGGVDRLRYDRSGVAAVAVDLLAGTATGTWGGIAFAHTISNIEIVLGSYTANDTLSGNHVGNILDGSGGNDLISGRGGNDTLFGGLGNDKIYGGDQFDTIHGGEGNDTVDGGNGRDLIFLNQGNDLFNDNTQGGDLGRDTVFAGLGDDTIQGGNGNDVFRGEAGSDLIFARFGNDLVYGGDQFDTIYGGAGNDTVDGGNGRDLIFLNEGNDLYNDNTQGGALGRDTVFAGIGNDTIQGGNGDDVFYGEAGNDRIFARLGNDIVYAGDQFDFIDAGDGNDMVFGGKGGDRVYLGNGNDVYVDTAQTGAFGQDTITGGAGVDRFVFQAVMSADVITDFQVGVDELRLTQSLWGGGLGAAQVVSTYASVTAGGVLFDFGAGQSILLEGLNSLAGLGGDILLA